MIILSSNQNQIAVITEIAPSNTKHTTFIKDIESILTRLYNPKINIPTDISRSIIEEKIYLCLSYLYLSYRREKTADQLERDSENTTDKNKKQNLQKQSDDLRKEANKFGFQFRTLTTGICQVLNKKYPNPSAQNKTDIAEIEKKLQQYDQDLINLENADAKAKKISRNLETIKSLVQKMQTEAKTINTEKALKKEETPTEEEVSSAISDFFTIEENPTADGLIDPKLEAENKKRQEEAAKKKK